MRRLIPLDSMRATSSPLTSSLESTGSLDSQRISWVWSNNVTGDASCPTDNTQVSQTNHQDVRETVNIANEISTTGRDSHNLSASDRHEHHSSAPCSSKMLCQGFASDALHRRGVCGDDLINHPVALSFVSKINSLCRMTTDRELAALGAIDQIEQGDAIEYEVIPL